MAQTETCPSCGEPADLKWIESTFTWWTQELKYKPPVIVCRGKCGMFLDSRGKNIQHYVTLAFEQGRNVELRKAIARIEERKQV